MKQVHLVVIAFLKRVERGFNKYRCGRKTKKICLGEGG